MFHSPHLLILVARTDYPGKIQGQETRRGECVRGGD